MKQTELITNDDGSIFHLGIKPGDLSEKIIIVGDPGRVDLIASNLSDIRTRSTNREFVSITGIYKGKEVSVISSGIGTDNIDILLNEIDALFNYDLETGIRRDILKSLSLIRLGTCGGLQKDIQPGQAIITEKAIGFDGLMNFYDGIEKITDTDFEYSFKKHLNWSERLGTPYIIDADNELLERFSATGFIKGMTISAPGFYAPQGRSLSIPPVDPEINSKIMEFRYRNKRILNYEMESSAIYGLSRLMGHKSLTICSSIGNRANGMFLKNYKPVMKELSVTILDLI